MIFTTCRIRNLELKNRLLMLAMHTGFADGPALNEREIAFYEERAKGGAAAVTCLLAVNEAGALKGMHDAKTVAAESLKSLAERVHAHDCRLIVQLFHCGRNESRKNHGEKPLLAPSALPSPIFRAEPQEMTAEDLSQTKADFASAAAFCKEIGADAVEISASAGYLLSEFFSPLTNRRTDAYGFENERGAAYPLEVLAAVRDAVGDYPVLVKISAAQMVEGGYELADMLHFCKKAEDGGLIDGVTAFLPRQQGGLRAFRGGAQKISVRPRHRLQSHPRRGNSRAALVRRALRFLRHGAGFSRRPRLCR